MTSHENSNDDTDQHGAPEDIKAKFRAALDKKGQQQHPHLNAGPGESKAHGPHGKAGQDKTFRRKSG